MRALSLAALAFLAASFALGWCSAPASAAPAPLGDPCSIGPCRVTGAVVGVKIPLPLGSAKPKLTVAPIDTPAGHAPKPLRLTIPPPGNFVGKFELVPLERRCAPLPKPPTKTATPLAGYALGPHAFVAKCPVLNNGHQYYAVRNTYLFRTAAGDYVTEWGGAQTDLASTPSATWSILPPDGPGAKEFPIHDACYRTHGTFAKLNPKGVPMPGVIGRTRAAAYTRAECDEILRQAMVALKVKDWQRVIVWAGVRVGGGAGWGS